MSTEAIRPIARPTPLRAGLALAAVLLVVGAIPALDVGLDGSAWDPVVIAFAVLAAGMTLATLVLVPLAWHGRRGPAIAVIVIQVVSILPALPAFLLPADEAGPTHVAAAAIGIALSLAACALVATGMRRRGDTA
ncbi:hypothetical protein [Demequina soli]|uniref:hypothetical protein n=1 Tax=Demequina soli TaxID=1638987 RepID=UPI000782B2BA|nr:hypothetical protein [Demequina soli]